MRGKFRERVQVGDEVFVEQYSKRAPHLKNFATDLDFPKCIITQRGPPGYSWHNLQVVASDNILLQRADAK